MGEFNKALELLKTKLDTSCEGRLYKSMGPKALAYGSEIYTQVLIHSIEVDAIRPSGVVILIAHFPSKYTGRWEQRTTWCATAKDALNVIDRCVGKPAALLDY